MQAAITAEARRLEILELPDDERIAFISRRCTNGKMRRLAEVLADVEEDLSGKMRERLIFGLRATLD